MCCHHSVGSGRKMADATPSEVPEQGHVEGWYRWVRLSDVVDFEEYGWRVVGRLTRFHYDSWLMFRPEDDST